MESEQLHILPSKATLTHKEKLDLVYLWNYEYPKALHLNGEEDLDGYLLTLQNPRHVMVIRNGKVVGWLCVFIRDNETWFAMILCRSVQKQGLGTKLLDQAKEENLSLSGWVIVKNNMPKLDDSIYSSPMLFYKANGFEMEANTMLNMPHFEAIKMKWTR
jgi:GNAT superfamily N-acetyltransferase